MKALKMLVACTVASLSVPALADFTYQETTQITGGSIVGLMKFAGTFSKQARQANDPMVTTVTVKGNRMVRASRDQTEIIDLDAGTVTLIDHVKKQYSTMTFEQMRQQMEAGMAKAQAAQERQQPQAAQSADAQKVDLKFNVKVRNTGASREVAGLGAHESILTMTADATDKQSGQMGSLAITNDMYLAPEIPGYEEVREFYKRYAVRMGRVMSGAMSPQLMAMLAQPGAGKGMADMVEEMSKLKGIPVLQIMRMGTTANGSPLPAASEGALPASAPQPSAGDVMKQSASAAIMSSIPFGGFGRKKKADPAPAPAAAADGAGGGAGGGAAVLMESKTELTSFSKEPVDGAVFAPPSTYKKVEPRQFNS